MKSRLVQHAAWKVQEGFWARGENQRDRDDSPQLPRWGLLE